jgi:hypothetical protein
VHDSVVLTDVFQSESEEGAGAYVMSEIVAAPCSGGAVNVAL